MKILVKLGLGVGVTLAAIGCGGGSSPGGGGGGGQGGGAAPLHGVAITLSDFMIMPESVTAKEGDVAFAVTNIAQTPHNFSVRDGGGMLLAQTPDLQPGKAIELETSLAAGTYVTFCALAGHESLGMKGELVVTP